MSAKCALVHKSKDDHVVQIKVCGMRDASNIAEVAALPIDCMGFIFYPPSKRYAKDFLDPKQLCNLPSSFKKVGVFVNASFSEMKDAIERYQLDVLQLHGEESSVICERLAKEFSSVSIWKAIGIGETFDLSALEMYRPYVDAFLFDTKTSSYGGSGFTFDWRFLEMYQGPPFFWLAGGIGSSQIREAKLIAQKHPWCVGIDVNSQVELSPGVKSISMLQFILDEVGK